MKSTLLVFISSISFCFTSFAGDAPPLDQQCTVQFKRDALGASANVPIPPGTDEVNGAKISVSGILKTVTSEWIHLVSDKNDLWIPKSSVLLIKIPKAEQDAAANP
jgi:hypothetical protein